jgi:hypothetical protein
LNLAFGNGLPVPEGPLGNFVGTTFIGLADAITTDSISSLTTPDVVSFVSAGNTSSSTNRS